MFESIKAMAGRAYDAMPEINKKNVAIGAGVVAAVGAAAYFGGPALAECVNPKEVCTETSRYFGLVTDKTCGVPTTFCRTAINSVANGLNQLAADALVGLKRLAIILGLTAVAGAALAVITRRIGSELAQPFMPEVPVKPAIPPEAPQAAATPSEVPQAAAPAAVAIAPAAVSGTRVDITYDKTTGKGKFFEFLAQREDGRFTRCKVDIATAAYDDIVAKYGQHFIDSLLNAVAASLHTSLNPAFVQIDAIPNCQPNPVIPIE